MCRRRLSKIILSVVFAILGIAISLTEKLPRCAGAENSSDDRVATTAISEEWAARPSRFRNVRISWHVVRNAQMPNSYQNEFPAEDKPDDSSDSVWFSDHRISHFGRRWYSDLKDEFAGFNKENQFPKFVEAMRRGHDDIREWDRHPYRFRLVWDGTTHHELLEGRHHQPSLGTIRDASKSLSLSSAERVPPGLMFWPILMAFRPEVVLGTSRFDQALQVENELIKIGNHQCLVMTGEVNPESTFRFWVDSAVGQSVVRAIIAVRGRVRQQFDIEYERDADGNWYPSAWTVLIFNPLDEYPGQAEVFQSAQVQVDSHEFNGTVTPKVFQIQFPTGTLVNDLIANKRYSVQEAGPSRPLSSSETKLLTGRADPEHWEMDPIFLRTAIVGFGLVSAIGLFMKLRRRRFAALKVSQAVVSAIPKSLNEEVADGTRLPGSENRGNHV